MKEYFDHYRGLKIAKDGEVMWETTYKTGHKHTWKTYGTLMRPFGYLLINYKKKSYRAHILVAEVFLNNNQPIDTMVYAVHHINGNKADNRVENLVILTIEEHARIHNKGEKAPWYGKLGADNPLSKPIIGVNKTTGEEVRFDNSREAERTLNISNSNISQCCKCKRKSAGGYLWRYA